MKGIINERIKEFITETGYYDGNKQLEILKIMDLWLG
jgi:hypothetical protein